MTNRFTKIKLLGSILSLFLITGVSSVSLSSCSDDNDEPQVELPEDENKPGETPEEPSDEPIETPEEPGEEEEPGEGEENNDGEFELPAEYTFPLSYVALPEGTPQQVKEYTGFTVNFNKDNHTPNYVAWELLSLETLGSVNRNDYNFWRDKDLEGCPDTNYDYSHTGYQRGHMCPAADQKWSKQAMYDCFSMANMCPQLASLNEKAWATLENKERDWAKRDGAIWIICGPIYTEEDTQRIGTYGVRVPGAFFKVFLYEDEEKPRTIAFVYPNGSCPGNMSEYAMSIDDLEEQLGYDFFPALPDSVENEIEATYSFTDWNK